MTHAHEIKYWAEHADGTFVWARHKDEGPADWRLVEAQNISWCCKDCIYIVADEWADLRKAQADGKQLQVDIRGGWTDRELVIAELRSYSPKQWRIKPRKIKKYKWAVINNGPYAAKNVLVTDGYYEDLEDLNKKFDPHLTNDDVYRIDELYIEEEP